LDTNQNRRQRTTIRGAYCNENTLKHRQIINQLYNLVTIDSREDTINYYVIEIIIYLCNIGKNIMNCIDKVFIRKMIYYNLRSTIDTYSTGGWYLH